MRMSRKLRKFLLIGFEQTVFVCRHFDYFLCLSIGLEKGVFFFFFFKYQKLIYQKSAGLVMLLTVQIVERRQERY